MKTVIQPIIFIMALLLVGCATPYQKGGRFGYHDSQLQENVFSVSFQGNAKSEPLDVQDYTLLRCAELCLQNGYKYFGIMSSNAGGKTGMYNTGGTANTTGTSRSIGGTTYGSYNTYNSPSISVPINLPNYTVTVICFKEKADQTQELYDAGFLGNSIAKKHGYYFKDGAVIIPNK